MESIKDWLNGSRNYNVGLALYLAYGTDAALKTALQQGESAYRKGRLLDALQELWENAPAHHKKSIRALTAPQVIPSQTAPQQVQAPVAYPSPRQSQDDPYYNDWHPLYKEMMSLRAKLALYPTDDERGAAAFRILDLETACKYYWKRRDYYLQNGVAMPEDSPKPDVVTDRNEMKAQQLNLRTYVTRYKKKLKDNPHDIKAQEKLDEYTRRLAQVDKQLER